MSKKALTIGATAVKALFSGSGLPGLGGIASLISDAQSAALERSMQLADAALAKRIAALEGRINASEVDQVELGDLLTTLRFAVAGKTDPARFDAAAAILANAMLPAADAARLPYTELDHFARCIDVLPAGAFAVLAVVYERELGVERKRGFFETPQFDYTEVARRLPDMHESLVMAMFRALDRENLVRAFHKPLMDADEHLFVRTDVGTKFVAYLLRAP